VTLRQQNASCAGCAVCLAGRDAQPLPVISSPPRRVTKGCPPRGPVGRPWQELAREFGCAPSRLTNLRTARLADMGLTMRVTQWLAKPAAEFIHAAHW
jgi:hypothetical protein